MNALEIAIELDARDQDINVDQINAFCDDLATYTVLGNLNVVLQRRSLRRHRDQAELHRPLQRVSISKANNLSDRSTRLFAPRDRHEVSRLEHHRPLTRTKLSAPDLIDRSGVRCVGVSALGFKVDQTRSDESALGLTRVEQCWLSRCRTPAPY